MDQPKSISELFATFDELVVEEQRLTPLNLNRDAKVINLIEAQPHFYLQLITAENLIHSRIQAIQENRRVYQIHQLTHRQKQNKYNRLQGYCHRIPDRVNEGIEIEGTRYYSKEDLELEIKKLALELEEKNNDLCSLIEEALRELQTALMCKQEILEKHPYLKGADKVQLEKQYGSEAMIQAQVKAIIGMILAQQYRLPERAGHILIEELSPSNAKLVAEAVAKEIAQTFPELFQKLSPYHLNGTFE